MGCRRAHFYMLIYFSKILIRRENNSEKLFLNLGNSVKLNIK